MRTCPKCGSPLKDEERYCFNCGEKIAPVTAPMPERGYGNEEFGMDDGFNPGRQMNRNNNSELDMPNFDENNNQDMGREQFEPFGQDETREPTEPMRDNRFDAGRGYPPMPERGPEQMGFNDRRMNPYEQQRQPPQPQMQQQPMMQNGQQMPNQGYPQQQQQMPYPPQMPQQPIPEKKKSGVLSRFGRVLELIIYMIFIAAAIGAVYMLNNFANSVNWGLL